MRVTTETVIDDSTTERFLELYRAAFDPLVPLAAARQSLTDDEFREEMVDPSVLKYVGWDGSGVPVALVMIATDLGHVPWISPEFWARRYPDHYRRGAIHYYGALLVSPTVRGGPWAARMLAEATRYTAALPGIAAFDCCRYNVDEVHLPELIASIAERICHLETVEVDVQRYYAFISHGLREVDIDLTEARGGAEVAEGVVAAG